MKEYRVLDDRGTLLYRGTNARDAAWHKAQLADIEARRTGNGPASTPPVYRSPSLLMKLLVFLRVR